MNPRPRDAIDMGKKLGAGMWAHRGAAGVVVRLEDVRRRAGDEVDGARTEVADGGLDDVRAAP